MGGQLRSYQLLFLEHVLAAHNVRTPMVVGLQRGGLSLMDDTNFVITPKHTTYQQMEARVWRAGRIRPDVTYVDFVNDLVPDAFPPNRIVSPDLFLSEEELWYRRLQPYRGSKASLHASMQFADIFNFGLRYGKRRQTFCEYLRHPLDDLVNHCDPYSNFPVPLPMSPWTPAPPDPWAWGRRPNWYYEQVERDMPPLDQTTATHPRNQIPGGHRVS